MRRPIAIVVAAVIVIVAAAVMILTGRARTQDPPLSNTWDTKLVRMDERESDWKDAAKAGLFMIPRTDAGEPAVYPYGQAARGDTLPGKLAVVGCFGALFTNESRFEVSSLGRKGSAIQLVITRHDRGGMAPRPDKKDKGKYLFFTALFPRDLPDGHYTVTCVMKDAEGTDQAPAPLKCEFDMTDVDVAEDHMAALQKLSKAELLAEYVAAGEALKDHGAHAVDLYDAHAVGNAGFESRTPRAVRFLSSEREIRRRGAEMIPPLVEMLKKEAVRNPELEQNGYGFGFARSLMKLLAETHDGNAAAAVTEVLGGMGGKVNRFLRWAAIDSLEVMTYRTFTHHSPHHGNFGIAVADDETLAMKVDLGHDVNSLGKAADKYHKWMTGEGNDSTKWLAIARARARTILVGDRLDDCYCAATFLWSMLGVNPADDQKDALLKRVVQILGECKRIENPNPEDWATHRWHDQVLPAGIGNWLGFVEAYGPAARPYHDTLARVLAQSSGARPSPLTAMGGEKSVATMMEMFKPLAVKAKASGLDRATNWQGIEDREKLEFLLVYQECRWGITRWVGRVFQKDEEITAWWKDNKGKTQEQWLRDGLDLTAAKADEGDAEACGLLRILLPDLPMANGEYPWSPPGSSYEGDFRIKKLPPYRVAWLKQSRKAGLVYDEQLGGFRLKGSGGGAVPAP